MSVWEYMRAKAPSLFVGAVGIASVCLVAVVCGCPYGAAVLMATVLLACLLCACAVDFLRSRRFYCDLRELTTSLERPYHMHSLVHEPLAPDQVIVYDALKAMGVVSVKEVAQADARASEHREFVEGWVHGIKAPLASCGLIAERVGELERSQLKSELGKIERQVQTVLWQARSDCANLDYAIREVALADIAKTACRDNARYLIEHECMPEVQIDPDQKVFTDAKQVGFVVTQAVENAAKYGASRIVFSSEHAMFPYGGGKVVLHIKDNGGGIPAEDIDRVFERGYTGTRGHESGASTGMGLYLAARLCEQLGLELSISSLEGEWTCVSVGFPLAGVGDKTVR